MTPKPHKRAAIYLTGTADADMRRAILTDEAKLRYWQVAATYHDTRGSRPELKGGVACPAPTAGAAQ
jgi:hypothetical protein